MATSLAVIGGGNMAQAIVRGALDAGILRPGEVVVVEPDVGKREIFAAWQVRATASHHEALASLLAVRPTILLAIKPQVLPGAAEQLRDHLPGAGSIVISILAGTHTRAIRAALGAGSVVRAMPNTAARVRQSITAIAAGDDASAEDLAGAERLLGALGPTVRIDESLMDAFTALSGSGPAYVFYLAEAMIRAGVSMGFEPEIADRAVRQTIAGAAALLQASAGSPPAELRAAVTSKGGTTEAAIKVLDDRAVMQAVIDALARGRDRARELAGS